MNKYTILVVSNVILWIVALSFGFVWFTRGNSQPKSISTPTSGVTIGYFILDSLETKYDYLLSLKRTFETKQNLAQNELLRMERSFQQKWKSYQEKLPSMTQSQTENSQRELAGMQQAFEEKKQQMQAQLIKDQADFAKTIHQSIEHFLEKNKDKYPYDFVIAAQPGLVFYKNTAYDITDRLVSDINEEYKNNK